MMRSLFIYLFFYRDVDVLFGDVLVIGKDSILLGLDDDVLQADVLNGHLRQTVKLHGAPGSIANYVLNVDIAEDWRFLGDGLLRGIVGVVAVGQHLCNRLTAIVHIEGDGICLDICHRDVVDEDVLYDTTAATRRLKAQADVGAEELTVLDKNVAHAAAHLGAYHEAA